MTGRAFLAVVSSLDLFPIAHEERTKARQGGAYAGPGESFDKHLCSKTFSECISFITLQL